MFLKLGQMPKILQNGFALGCLWTLKTIASEYYYIWQGA